MDRKSRALALLGIIAVNVGAPGITEDDIGGGAAVAAPVEVAVVVVVVVAGGGRTLLAWGFLMVLPIAGAGRSGGGTE